MFTLQAKPTFRAKVAVHRPGEPEAAPFTVEFRHMTQSKLQAFLDETKSKRDQEAIDALASIIVSWESVGTPAGEPVPFSRDALAQMIDQFPATAQSMFVAYAAELAGSRLGN